MLKQPKVQSGAVSDERVELGAVGVAAHQFILKTGPARVVIVQAAADSAIDIKFAAEKSFAENGGVSADLSAIDIHSSVIDQIGGAPGITGIDADGEVVTQPVIGADGEVAGGDVVTGRIGIVVTHVHEIARAGDEHAPAIVGCGGIDVARALVGERNFAVRFLGVIFPAHLRRETVGAKTVGAGADIVHAPLQVVVLHDRLRKPDLIYRGEFFRRDQIVIVRQTARAVPIPKRQSSWRRPDRWPRYQDCARRISDSASGRRC